MGTKPLGWLVLGALRKPAEQTIDSKPVISTPPRPLNQFLPQTPALTSLGDRLQDEINPFHPSWFWPWYFITTSETPKTASVNGGPVYVWFPGHTYNHCKTPLAALIP